MGPYTHYLKQKHIPKKFDRCEPDRNTTGESLTKGGGWVGNCLGTFTFARKERGLKWGAGCIVVPPPAVKHLSKQLFSHSQMHHHRHTAGHQPINISPIHPLYCCVLSFKAAYLLDFLMPIMKACSSLDSISVRKECHSHFARVHWLIQGTN